MLAATNTTAIALLVLGGLLLALSIGALVLRHRTKRAEAEIPQAMRPGPSDSALETPVLQRLQGWGLVMLVFAFVVLFAMSFVGNARGGTSPLARLRRPRKETE